MVERATNWGVLMYLLAGLASIAVPIVLTAAPRSTANLFPEPKYDDVVRVIESVYR